MKRFCSALAVTASFCLSLPAAQPVVILEMPPPGGDGHAALQSGSAISSGLAGAWYNPALLSGLNASTGSNIHVTSSRQDVAAIHQQDFSGVAVVYPGLGRDLGVSIYRNAVQFVDLLPAEGPSSEESDFGESVYGLAAGFGLTRFASLGLAAKYYQSEIGTGRANGWAFDFGGAYSRPSRPARGLQSLEVTPSVGVALRNLGADAWYVDPELSDPLPRVWSNALGLKVSFADFVHVSLGHDWERPVHRRADWSDSWQRTYGYTAAVLGFRYGQGWLKDPEGQRNERHVMREYEFNLKRMAKAVDRFREGDFTSAGGPAAGRSSVLGVRVNPRLVVGNREIVTDIRKGQKAWYFSLSL